MQLLNSELQMYVELIALELPPPQAIVASWEGKEGRAGRAGQGKAGQDRAGQGRAGQGRAGQVKAGQGRARQGRAIYCQSIPIIFDSFLFLNKNFKFFTGNFCDFLVRFLEQPGKNQSY